MDIEAEIIRELSPILNLPITIARNAGNMKNFQFGRVRPSPTGKGTVGESGLHVECPWRILADDRILTGSEDLHEPAEDGGELDDDDLRFGNLQQKLLGTIFGTYDPATRSLVDETNALVVTAIHADRFGGLDLEIAGGFRLQVFPSGSREEEWRFISHEPNYFHVVLKGGRLSKRRRRQ
jgi:hypothetical protein